MFQDFSDQARKVMALAEREARQFQHEYVGTEHILVALMNEDAGIAADVLNSLGFAANVVRGEIDRLVQCGSMPVSRQALPLTPRARQAIEFASEEARNVQQKLVDVEHLLLGLMREPDGVAGQVLRNLGVRPDQVRAEVLKIRIRQMQIVERAVRPVRAGTPCKRKMREELLAHLTANFDQEMARLHEPNAALQAAARRFGDPAELASELQAALPYYERFSYLIERVFAWRAPESVARYSFRIAAYTFWILSTVLGLVQLGVILGWGWTDAVQTLARIFGAIIGFTPPTQFAVAFLQIKMRDSLWGTFGSRKSMATALALAGLMAAVVMTTFFGLVAVAVWDVEKALQSIPLFVIVGILFAVGGMLVARFGGPATNGDTMWALLDIGGESTVEAA